MEAKLIGSLVRSLEPFSEISFMYFNKLMKNLLIFDSFDFAGFDLVFEGLHYQFVYIPNLRHKDVSLKKISLKSILTDYNISIIYYH
jgi:hypothetical protein